ncbi:P-loop NTPase fold protein [Streptomyces bicolor]|uniref:P-loop NTPase fold protein n=1 Tax=Streptomyces bicolor TaxID=66874 RepID=UPI000997253E|nr:P-loop NTPase fold protein [Streptomyces bicolor]
MATRDSQAITGDHGSAVASGSHSVTAISGDSVQVTFASPPLPFTVPHQLPRHIGAFTGRRRELDDLLTQLAPSDDHEHVPPPVLVTGMAGVGKSAVVLQAAHEAVQRGWFPGGTIYLDLHGYDRTEPVAPAEALASALLSVGVPSEHIPIDVDSRAALYRTALSGMREALLLMVDNAADAEQVRPLLPADPRHRIVITSRHRLPSLMARTISLGTLATEEGIQLLDAAVRRAHPGDVRVAQDLRAAEIIVERTGGLPLALAVIAARLTTNPSLDLARVAQELAAEADRLHDRTDRLDDGERSVAAAIELSFRHLPPEQAQLLVMLALTVGRRFSTAAVAAGLDTDVPSVRHLLEQLSVTHLIEDTSQHDQWQMHDLIRHYATTVADDVVDAARLERVRDRIIDYFLRHSDPADDGSGFFTTRIGTRPLAGVHGDGPSSEDRLGVVRDVEVLAELIAAAETRPPLSIALIGNWGAGKSSVMLQVERQVDLLAQLSSERPGRSAFVSSVRQVRFNAWHYSDTNVWTGLITHLFTALAGDDTGDAPNPAPDPEQARRDRELLREKLNQREEAERQVSERLTTADDAAPAPGRFAALGSPIRTYRVLRATLLQSADDLRFSRRVLALWLVLAGVATGAWLLRGTLTAWLTSLLAIAVAAAPLRPLLQKLRMAQQGLLGFTERRYGELAAQQRALRAEISGLRERLALVDAAARLGQFLQERADGTAYQPYRGVLGQAHADLLQLGRDLEDARVQWRAEKAGSPPPLERIVLYVDDLDRCPPDRVVEVLQAVHLMLGLDLFVVVVAVDARWLIHSLRHHHNALFQHENTNAADTAPDVGGLATAVDYLDKIFQIPYALTPPPPQTMGRYLRSLLPDPHVAEAGRPFTEASPPVEERALDEAGTSPRPEADGGTTPSTVSSTSEPIAMRGPATGSQPAERTEHADLLPQGLRIGAGEVAFMAQLGALLPTPRAAKRLVNLYRLVRIGIPATDLPAFASSSGPAPYQAVQILLAVLAGDPRAAEELFRRLLACPGDGLPLTALLEDDAAGHPAYERLAQALPAVLRKLEAEQAIPLAVGHYRRWCGDLARYSFHTRNLAPAPDAPSGRAAPA